MNSDNAKKWIGKPMIIDVAMLIVGVLIGLPGNLKGDQMKVERKDHELLITIPKA